MERRMAIKLHWKHVLGSPPYPAPHRWSHPVPSPRGTQYHVTLIGFQGSLQTGVFPSLCLHKSRGFCCIMPSYKVIYFPSRGRAEPIRMCFAAAGVEFEDVRIAGEKWAEFKPSKFVSWGVCRSLFKLLCFVIRADSCRAEPRGLGSFRYCATAWSGNHRIWPQRPLRVRAAFLLSPPAFAGAERAVRSSLQYVSSVRSLISYSNTKKESLFSVICC